VIPANSVFTSTTASIFVLECAAPNGVSPTQISACDGNTISPDPINANSDGSINYAASEGSLYTLYSLPSSVVDNGSTSGPVCGSTSATECILYIGQNQGDFTAPHVWSQPFYVENYDGNNDGGTPGDGTPEVPMAILLPLAAMGLIGGTVLVRRRRAARSVA
jgi:hypothetical protein